jgi:uncharacterized protein YndB with AHSA1/START domain
MSKTETGRMMLETIGETDVLVTRYFAASPEAVYRAHTEPRLIQQWLLGPKGWTMPVCENDARAGGEFRYEWVKADGSAGFSITGEILEIEPGKRIVHVERLHRGGGVGPTPDNRIETRFDAEGKGTLMTMRMHLPDEKTRAMMLATGMEKGMEASYVRLEGLGEAGLRN